MLSTIYAEHQKVNKGLTLIMSSVSDSKDRAMHSLHKIQEWNRFLGKWIIRPTSKDYLSFEEVVIEYLHDMDHISLCIFLTIGMKRQNLEPSRKLFMEISK